MNSDQQVIASKDLQKLKGGFILILISITIPFLLLVNLRYLIVDSYVSPTANQTIGLIASILMVLSTFVISPSIKAVEKGDFANVYKRYGWTFLIALVAWILIGAQVVNHSISTVTHFGETFISTLGVIDTYILFGMVALISVRMRIKNMGTSISHVWGVRSTVMFWNYLILIWLILYAVLYIF